VNLRSYSTAVENFPDCLLVWSVKAVILQHPQGVKQILVNLTSMTIPGEASL